MWEANEATSWHLQWFFLFGRNSTWTKKKQEIVKHCSAWFLTSHSQAIYIDLDQFSLAYILEC